MLYYRWVERSGCMPQRIGLALSGGGFRATLFHLGVVRLLNETGQLSEVKRIGAVSGGSILAAHLVLHWEQYAGSKEDFDKAAQEIIQFVQKGIRGQVIRRWIFARLCLALPRLLMPGSRRRWTRTNLLQKQYGRLYKNKALKDLRASNRPPGCDDPSASIQRLSALLRCLARLPIER